MATSQTNPASSAPQTVRTTKSGLNLDNFEDVSLYKDVPVVEPVKSVEDALHRLGNDHARLLSILTQGLQSETVEAARTSADGWLTFEDGKPTDSVFSGTLVPEEASPMVNNLVLSLAKNVFSYNEAKDADERRAAKSAARDFIKSNETMLNGLKANIAASTKTTDGQ